LASVGPPETGELFFSIHILSSSRAAAISPRILPVVRSLLFILSSIKYILHLFSRNGRCGKYGVFHFFTQILNFGLKTGLILVKSNQQINGTLPY
jgi:hypothetical protein